MQVVVTEAQANTKVSREIHDFGTHVVQSDLKTRTQVFDHPVQIGDSYFNNPQEQIKAFENTAPRYGIA